MRIRLYPYGPSNSARDLVRAIPKALRIRERGAYRPRRDDVIVNWGNPRIPGWWTLSARNNILNQPEAVRRAINKITALQFFTDNRVPCPDWTRDQARAAQWLDAGHKVLARTTVSGKGGVGIRVLREPRDMVHAPLYVKYKKKEAEYRIHVFNGEVIDRQQKRRRNDAEQDDNQKLIRSHKNGWIFARENVTARQEVDSAAISAVNCLGLTFGAVDIGWHSRHGICVYEVNTAPGIEGTSINNYAAAITRITRSFM